MLARIAALLRIQPPVVDNRGKLWGSGADYPTLGDDGWQTGAIWCNTTGDAGTSLYVNEGSVTSCNFVAVDTTAGASAGAITFDDNVTGPLISIETADPTNNSYLTPFLITGTYSSTCALAIQLSATNQRPVSFLFDDGGEILGAGNYRGVLSRVLLCSTQTGQIALRAIRGQVKVKDGLALNIGANEFNLISGIEGYMELAGTTARTVGVNTRVSALAALLEINQDITLNAGGKCVGVLVQLAQTTAKSVSGIGTAGVAVGRIDSDHATHQAVWGTGFVTGDSDCTLGIMLGAATGGITFSGLIADQVIKYATTTSVGDTTAGHLIQYGTSASAIIYTPTVTGSHSGIQMYITSANCIGGLGMVGVRVRVELTGTSNATINAGQFWAKINCTDYTGHYLGGHPTGVSGIIEIAGTARTATSQYAVMAGVCGEVRPITASGTVNVGGVICGIHAKIFGVSTDVDTGDVVGVMVQALGASASDIGILVQPHTGGAAWTTGLEFDSSYGTITNGIVFTGTIPTRILDYANVTEIDEPGAGHLIRYGASGAPIVWTPTATCSGLQMYITSDGPEVGGFGLAGVRVKVTLTGTTRITANAGQFWTKIDCTDYTGHYLGGHPTGLSGIIECAGTDRQAGSVYAVMAGVCGEVRPITTTTPNLGGVICGLHAKIFAVTSEVTTGSVVGVLVQAIAGSAADIGILIQPHTGGAAWTVGIDIDSVYGPIPTGIDIGTCTTAGIDFTGSLDATVGIRFTNATFAPEGSRDNRAIELGSRGSEIGLAFTGVGGAENFEPIQMNFNCTGTTPDTTSTVNIWQGGLFLDTHDLDNVRLKWSDLLTTVNFDCKDVYIHQAEIKFGDSAKTVSREVAVLGLVLDGGTSTTCTGYRGINVTLRGAGTPANATGVYIRVESGATVTNGIELRAEGTMSSGIRLGNISGSESPTNFIAVPTAGTDPVVASVDDGDGEGSIKILVGAATKYLKYWADPTS